jgi:hypothetical protein
MSQKIVKRFASYLKFREAELAIDNLEKAYGILLPPIYKSFIQEFEGIYGDVYLDSNGELTTLTYYKYEMNGADILFEDFMNVEEVLMYAKNCDTWVENNVIPISNHSHGGTILLGVGPNNSDKLFYEHDRGQVLIEENIFSFLRNLTFVLNISSINHLYKNWGEDFWRVRN